MIAGLAAVLPPALAACAGRLEVGTCPGKWRPASGFRDRAVLAEVLATFGRSFDAADERALLSYWSQFYFAALVIPAVAATLCLGRRWPLALDAVDFTLDASGVVDRFRLPDEGAQGSAGFAPLIEDHLAPFIDACAAYNGLSRRTLWCNAGAMFDYAVRELSAAGTVRTAPTCGADKGCLEPRDLLFEPYRARADAAIRKRKLCCLRFKVPGVPCCGDVCPTAARSRCPAA